MALFHVKQSRRLPGLFSDAKLTKDHIQRIFNVDLAQQPPKTVSGGTEIFSDNLLACVPVRQARREVQSGLLQQHPVPLPGNQP